ncbi:MAG: ABC transporter permease [Legionellales bacterium]|nr:ABC transporter permease [Legionellales bacterium]
MSIWIGFYTLLRKEVTRFLRIWSQTLLPPAISVTLYFIIFGHVLGSRVGLMDGYPYLEYIVPGLVMMSIITSAYANVSSSFFSLKFQRSIDEITLSPLPTYAVLLAFVTAGVIRGLLVGSIVTVLALFFTRLNVVHPLFMLLIVVLSAMLFSLAGFLNGLFAKKFDDISIVPTFVLTPLTYLGGVFYSVNLLPDFWHKMSLLNPVLYMVSSFRFSILGVSDINVYVSTLFIIIAVATLFFVNLRLLERGYGIRT